MRKYLGWCLRFELQQSNSSRSQETHILFTNKRIILIGALALVALTYAYFAFNTPVKYPVYIDDIQIRYNGTLTKTIDFNDRSLNELAHIESNSQYLLKVVDTEYHSPPYCLALENAYTEHGTASLKLGPKTYWRSFEAQWYLNIRDYGSTGTSIPIFWVFFSNTGDLAFNIHVNFDRSDRTSESTVKITTMYYNYSQPTPLKMKIDSYSAPWKLGEWQQVSILFSKDRSTITLKINNETAYEDAWKPEYVDQPAELRWIS